MELDLIQEFEALKISSLGKAKKINSFVHDVTIGPGSNHHRILENEDTQETKVDTEEKEIRKIEKPYTGSSAIFQKTLREIENQRQEEVKAAIHKRFNKIAEFNSNQKQQQKNDWYQKQMQMISDIKKQEAEIMKAVQQQDQEKMVKDEEIRKYYKSLAEKQKAVQREHFAKEQETQEITRILDAIKANQFAFRNVFQEISTALRPLPKESLRKYFPDIPPLLKSFTTLMDDVLKNVVGGRIVKEELDRSNELVEQISALKNSIKVTIQEKILNELENAKEPPKVPEPTVVVKEETPPPTQTRVSKTNQEGMPMPIGSSFNSKEAPVQQHVKTNETLLNECGSKESLLAYAELQDYLQKFEEGYSELLKDPNYKQFTFDCKKAINIPVNAISATSKEHLLDKYKKLSNLLSGNEVEVGESRRVKASDHPLGVQFCTYLLARKFVLQGDLMISGNPDAAYPYAYIIVKLWRKFPTFGKLLIAHFYRMCPYLVPFYVPRVREQSVEEYLIAQGYQLNEGIIEEPDKFLKRMTGITRLYATILITKYKKENETTEVYGPTKAWLWLTTILNLEPRPQITATVLHVFLETAGYSLQRLYGKQFLKLVHIIIKLFLPLLQKIDSGGPVTRLEVMMKEYLENRQFNKPSREKLSFLENQFHLK